MNDGFGLLKRHGKVNKDEIARVRRETVSFSVL